MGKKIIIIVFYDSLTVENVIKWKILFFVLLKNEHKKGDHRRREMEFNKIWDDREKFSRFFFCCSCTHQSGWKKFKWDASLSQFIRNAINNKCVFCLFFVLPTSEKHPENANEWVCVCVLRHIVKKINFCTAFFLSPSKIYLFFFVFGCHFFMMSTFQAPSVSDFAHKKKLFSAFFCILIKKKKALTCEATKHEREREKYINKYLCCEYFISKNIRENLMGKNKFALFATDKFLQFFHS